MFWTRSLFNAIELSTVATNLLMTDRETHFGLAVNNAEVIMGRPTEEILV
jgi:hypothetical protein